MSYDRDIQGVSAAAASAGNLTSTGDKLVYTPVTPVELVGFGCVITTEIDDGSGDGLVIKADKRIAAGSDSGRTDGTLGTLTLTTAQADNLAVGKTILSRPANPATLQPGEQVVLELTNAVATAGAGHYFVLVRPADTFDDADVTVVTE